MAAYPPGPSRLVQLPDLAGGQSPSDLMYLIDVSLGTNAGDASDVKSTLNDIFAEITKNITDLTVQFGNGVTGTVSAAGKGKLRYNDTAGSFQVSENGAAYQNLLKGNGTATRVAFWSAADELSHDAALYWDNTNKRLSVGVGTSPGAPIDVLAESVSAIAQQWRPNTGSMRAAIILDGGPETFFGTTTAHNLHLITTDIQRLSIEATSGNVGINKAAAIAAQLQVVANAATTKALILNSAPATSVNIAEFYNDSSIRYTFGNSGTLTLGLAGASGATGAIVFSVNGQSFTSTLRAGDTPASSVTYKWPSDDPAATEVLTVTSFAAGVATLEWAPAGTLSGSGTATRVAFWTGTSSLGSDAAYYWDNTNKRLSVGVGTSPGAPIDVLAESVSAIAQQWRPNTGSMRAAIILDGGPETFFGTTTAHNLHLITNNLQRLSIEDTSGNVGINKAAAIAAQLQVVANAATTKALILNSAAATSVNIAEFYNDSSIRYTFGNSGTLTLGLAGASGATGQLTFAVNGQANTQTLRAGDTPAASNTFKWPSADPTAGQVLTASAPSGGVVTLSWATGGGGTTINPTDGVIPVRSNATTFIDSPLSVASSVVTYTRNSIGTAQTTGVEITNTTAAAAGAQQFSPGLVLTSQGWKTNAVAASQSTNWLIQNQSVQGTANPTTNLAFYSQVNAGGYTQRAFITSNGYLAVTDSTNGSVPNLYTLTDATYGIAILPSATRVSMVIASAEAFRVSTTADSLTRDIGASNGGRLFLGSGGTSDAFLRRAASGIFNVNGPSSAAGGVLIAPTTASITGNFTVLPDNAATNTVVTVARFGVNSTGTAADGFGTAISFSSESSTTNDTETGRENCFWTTASHATRTAAFSWSLTNNASLAEYMRLSAPAGAGGAMALSIYEGTAPNVWTSGSYAAKLYLISSTLRATGVVAHFSNTGADSPQWQFLRGAGTNASPTAIQNTYGMGDLEWWGQTSTSTNNVVAGARIRVSATENWSAGNNGCQMIFYTSNNASTITDRMYIKETGTVRIGATAGSYTTTTLLQIGGYSSWNTDVVGAIYTGANGTKGVEIIGTSGQTASLLRIFRDSLTPDLLTLAASGVLSLRAGLNTGTTTAKVGGTIHENLTPVSNSSTTETNLMSYSLPANTLGTDNDYLELEAWGEFTSAVSNKRVRMYFGSTVIFDTTAAAFGASAWRIQARVVRGSSTTQVAISVFSGNTTLVSTTAQVAAPAETLSGAVTIKCTGQSSVGSDEIFQEGFIVRWNPASN